MLITEKCLNLVEKFVRYDNYTILKAQAQKLEQRGRELAARRVKLGSPVQSALFLGEKSILSADDWPDQDDLEAMVQQIAMLQGKLVLSPDALTEGTTYNNLLSHLDQLAQSLLANNKAAWEAYVDRTAPSVSEQYLNLLAGFPKYAPQIRRVKDLIFKIREARNQVPTVDDEISDFQTLASRLQKALNELDLSDFPEEVKVFLQAAQSQVGAPLSGLTQVVVEWLTKRRLVADFRIRFSNASRV